jgi:flagellar biosynthesis GTPase FlhF
LPIDSERLSELKETIRKIKPTHRLAVFSALTRSSDIRATAREITWLEPTNLVFTQIDLTKRLGGILAATKATDVKLAMITDSPSGADSYRAPDAKAIADTILGREEQSE